MSINWNTVWAFNTDNFRVELQTTPEQDDPEDHFEFQDDINDIRNGDIAWFMARVVVFYGEANLGEDNLGGCAYHAVEDFFTGHRDPDPTNRNCSIMRKAKGENSSIGHHFPEMVRIATRNARQMIKEINLIKIKA